jgi:fructose-bisphosphate aldolase, class I
MTRQNLEEIAYGLAARGKGILAADETPGTLTRRFQAAGIESTSLSRRDYRELLLTTRGVEAFISGAILQDETIRQPDSTGWPLVSLCSGLGIVPGIKVDRGAKPLAGSPEERVTEGLDGLRDRLAEYRALGARFAKWRAVFSIADALPTRACIAANAHALARYAALCQEVGLVPIVEPEVLMTGAHGIERCGEVTGTVLHAVFAALEEQSVHLEGIVLKPNMVLPGSDAARRASPAEVAGATLRCLRRHVPAAVPSILFLSGGQSDVLATRHLDAIQRAPGARPWQLSFSYGRALQDAPLAAWEGKPSRVGLAQTAFLQRARANSLAALGRLPEHEEEPKPDIDARLADEADHDQ